MADHPPAEIPPQLVVMGVAGSGKTTVGSAVAERLGVPYADADAFHPPTNVAKMRAGTPLDDGDRAPWLAAVGSWLAEHPAGGVVSCSALRRRYRDQLRSAAPQARFLHLSGATGDVAAVLAERVAARTDHFMPASLVTSQLELLEPLDDDEAGLVVHLTDPVDAIVDAACTHLPILTGAPR